MTAPKRAPNNRRPHRPPPTPPTALIRSFARTNMAPSERPCRSARGRCGGAFRERKGDVAAAPRWGASCRNHRRRRPANGMHSRAGLSTKPNGARPRPTQPLPPRSSQTPEPVRPTTKYSPSKLRSTSARPFRALGGPPLRPGRGGRSHRRRCPFRGTNGRR